MLGCRVFIEQGVKNSAYIYHLNILLHDLGYCKNVTPKLGVKPEAVDQWKISIWKQSMPDLVSIVKPYFFDEMKYKFIGYL